MKVLVVGGAGYIGSHAARVLRSHGHDVLIYDDLSTGFERLAKGFQLVVGDLGDRDRLRPALAGADAVMHFAALAYVGESVTNPRKYFHNNVESALTLLNTALDAAGADDSGEIGELHDPETHLIPLALAASQPGGPALNIFGTDYPTPDGTCIRDYIHVNDLAEAHALALARLADGGESFAANLG